MAAVRGPAQEISADTAVLSHGQTKGDFSGCHCSLKHDRAGCSVRELGHAWACGSGCRLDSISLESVNRMSVTVSGACPADWVCLLVLTAPSCELRAGVSHQVAHPASVSLTVTLTFPWVKW